MTCEEADELLPWLLNGTLEAGEERRVREHLAGCERCRAALADTRFAWRVFDEHVATGDLVAYAFDDPAPGLDRTAVERHVAECPRCASELEMVRASRLLGEHEKVATFPLPAAAPAPRRFRAWRSGALAAGLVGVVALAGWLDSSARLRSLEAQLGASARGAERSEGTPPAVAPSPGVLSPGGEAERVARLEEENRRLAARAEALSRSQQELESRAGELERRMAEQAAAPQPSAAAPAAGVNTAIRDLYPGDRGERGTGGEEAARPLPKQAALVTLILHARGEGAGERTVEVVDAAGKVVFRAGGLVRDPDSDGYVLTLDRGRLRPGRYSLRLQGKGGEAPETFALDI
jgi:Putative zinc-finger